MQNDFCQRLKAMQNRCLDRRFHQGGMEKRFVGTVADGGKNNLDTDPSLFLRPR
jgi:hypothetical protein